MAGFSKLGACIREVSHRPSHTPWQGPRGLGRSFLTAHLAPPSGSQVGSVRGSQPSLFCIYSEPLVLRKT